MSVVDYEMLQNIRRFEEETGCEYEDHSPTIDTPNSIPNTMYDGKTDKEISTWKDVGYSAVGAFKDFVKQSVIVGMSLNNKVQDFIKDSEFDEKGMTRVKNDIEWDPEKHEAVEKGDEINFKKSYQPQTLAGNITYDVGKGLLGLGAAAGVTGAAGLTGAGGVITKIALPSFAKTKNALQIGKVLSPALNNMLGSAAAFWVDKENLANILNEHIDNPYAKMALDYLEIKEDDSGAERALKFAIEELFIGAAADLVFKMFKYVKLGSKSREAIERVTTLDAVSKNAPSKNALKEAVSDASKETATDLKDIVGKMREVEPENYARLKKTAYQKFTKSMGVDLSQMDTKTAREFIDKADSEIDKVVIAVKNSEDQAQSFIENMQSLRKDVEAGLVKDEDKYKATMNHFMKLGDSVAAVQDASSQSGRALGYVSKSETYKNMKEVMEFLSTHADEVNSKKLYELFSPVESVDELFAKMNSLFDIGSSSIKKGKLRWLTEKFVALEQAGLMTNLDTVARNAYAAVDMSTLGAAEDAFASVVGKTRAVIKEAFGHGDAYNDIVSMQQGIRMASNFFSQWNEVIKWGLNKMRRLPTGDSPWLRYRKIAEGTSKFLPSKVGKTFSDKNIFGKILNGWMSTSGVGVSEAYDDFTHSVYFRSEAANLAENHADMIAKADGLTAADRDVYYNTVLSDALDVDFDKKFQEIEDFADDLAYFLSIKSIRDKAGKYASEMTFRGKQGAFTQELTKKMNGMLFFTKPLIPFVKTLSTIVVDRFIMDRTFMGLLFRADKIPGVLKAISRGGRERDRFIAKQFIGNGLLFLGTNWALDGKITGPMPSNKSERDAWIAAGIQPYSLVLNNDDGTVSYMSFDGFGPMSMLLKTSANIAQLGNETDEDSKRWGEDEYLQKWLTAASIGIGHSFFDDTILRDFGGFMNFLDRRDAKGTKEAFDDMVKKFQQTAMSPIPRFLESFPTEYEQSVETGYEMLKKKFRIDGTPKRDMFGRPIKTKSNLLSIIPGIKVTKRENDIVMNEIVGNEAFLRAPTKTLDHYNTSIELDTQEYRRLYEILEQQDAYGQMQAMMLSPDYEYLTKERKKDKIRETYGNILDAAIEELVLTSFDGETTVKNKFDEAQDLEEEKDLKPSPTTTFGRNIVKTVPKL